MQTTKSPGPEYLPVSRLDMGNKRLNLAVNVLGFVILIAASWMLYVVFDDLRPGILAPSSFLLLGGPELLALIAGLAAVIILHELIHGFFFWIFTGERFQLGVRPFYAFAASPQWYFPRGKFAIIGLAPFLIISGLGLLLVWLLPLAAAAVALVSLAVNAAGSAGDLFVVGWLFTKPSGRLVRDRGDIISKYNTAPKSIVPMIQRWMDLMRHFGVDEEAARQEFVKLLEAYTGNSRYYHNLDHVRSVLDTIAELEDQAQDLKTLFLATWFHDVVYVAGAEDNEVESARYGYETCIELGIDEATATRVSDLILMTIDHNPPEDDGDAKILTDSDLAPLGYEDELFRKQSEAIRLEFAQVPDDEFYASRRVFFEGMLDREKIFRTRELYAAYEDKARENIKFSLAALP